MIGWAIGQKLDVIAHALLVAHHCCGCTHHHICTYQAKQQAHILTLRMVSRSYICSCTRHNVTWPARSCFIKSQKDHKSYFPSTSFPFTTKIYGGDSIRQFIHVLLTPWHLIVRNKNTLVGTQIRYVDLTPTLKAPFNSHPCYTLSTIKCTNEKSLKCHGCNGMQF